MAAIAKNNLNICVIAFFKCIVLFLIAQHTLQLLFYQSILKLLENVLHYTNWRSEEKKKEYLKIRYGTLHHFTSFFSESENTIVNIFYQDNWESLGDNITPETNLIYLLNQRIIRKNPEAWLYRSAKFC